MLDSLAIEVVAVGECSGVKIIEKIRNKVADVILENGKEKIPV